MVETGRLPLGADHARKLLAIIFVSAIAIGLNATMINIALPTIVSDLDASAEQSTWLLLSYLVVSGATYVFAGQLSDAWGPGAVIRGGLLLFLLTAIGLAMSTGPEAFIVMRAVQGLGAAMLLSASGALIAVAFPRARIRSAFATYLGAFAIAQVAGPVVGGLVTAVAGWRWLFAVTAGVTLLALVTGWQILRGIDFRSARTGRPIDPWGNVIILAGLSALLYALSYGPQQGWTSLWVASALAVAVTSIPLFVMVERRVLNPAVHVELLSDRVFLLANVSGFLDIIPRMVTAIMLSLYYQGLQGAGPVEAAIIITPAAVAVTVGSLVAGRLGAGVNQVRLAFAMCLGAAVGVTGVGVAIALGGSPVWVGLGLVVTGLTTGVFSTLNSSAILAAAPPGRAGSTNGVRSLFQSAGLSVGTALMLAIVVSGLSAGQAQAFYAGDSDALSAASEAMLRTGYLRAFSVMLVLVLAVGALVLLYRRWRPRVSRT